MRGLKVSMRRNESTLVHPPHPDPVAGHLLSPIYLVALREGDLGRDQFLQSTNGEDGT